MLPDSLSTALKEWKLVADALSTGRQVMLLRKGGISEMNGVFELEHRRFAFYPTYIHQNLSMLKDDAKAGFEAVSAEPERIMLSTAGEVTDILRVRDRSQVDALDAEHVWTKPLIDMRFDYRPQNPLYVLLVRAYRLPGPVTVANTPAYAGCKSWVPLETPVSVAGALPAMDDEAYEARCRRILEVVA